MFQSQDRDISHSTSSFCLDFSPKTVGEWRDLLNQVTQVTWNQTFQYAVAMAKAAHQSTRFASILKDQTVIGVASIQETKLGPIHHITCFRGPLWLPEHDLPENFYQFGKALTQTFPKRPLRKLRWMPEREFDDHELKKIKDFCKLEKTGQSFETLWMDLSLPLEELRSRLDRKWRNHLSKAERSEIQIMFDTQGRHLKEFLRSYDVFKAQRKFEGPNGNFMSHEIEKALPFKDALLLWARVQGIPVAGILVMRHGNSASYRIAWNTIEGRQCNAHYLLLWKSIEALKKLNVRYLDLGGVLSDDHCGLNIFKLGLNGARKKTETLG